MDKLNTQTREGGDAFSVAHPLVAITYFAFAIGCSFAFMHPVCLGVSLVCSVSYTLLLGGRKALRFAVTFLLPMFVIAAIANPLFSHSGVTVLRYLPSGNPLTLESVWYGVAAA